VVVLVLYTVQSGRVLHGRGRYCSIPGLSPAFSWLRIKEPQLLCAAHNIFSHFKTIRRTGTT
jgi:hypothetical protein